MKKKTDAIIQKTLPGGVLVTLRFMGSYDDISMHISLLYKTVGRWAFGPVFAFFHDYEHKKMGADIELAIHLRSRAKAAAAAAVKKTIAHSPDLQGSAPHPHSRDKISATRAQLVLRNIAPSPVFSMLYKGDYAQLKTAYTQFREFLKSQNLAPAGPWRETYLKGPGMFFKGNPAKYLTEIAIATKPL